MDMKKNAALLYELPDKILKLMNGQEYTIDDIGQSGSVIFIFEDKILKIQKENEETRSEVFMMQWLKGKLPVPEVLCHHIENGKDYLLMTRMQGKMTCDEEYMEQPELLVEILAEGLKKLWEVNIMDCPVVWDINAKLPIAKEAVENGRIDVNEVEPETFGEGGFENPQALYKWLVEHKPEEELVLSHGDFCLPNIFAKDKALSGFIDLGRCGIADKWQDIAICYRSLLHNFSGKYAAKEYPDFDPAILFEKLGIEPDWEKINYHRLMDELF